MTKKWEKKNNLDEIIDTKYFYEKKYAGEGYKIIAGIDEAGRGPLAGPVVAAAVVIQDSGFTEKIDDSKKLSPKKREKAYIDIIKRCDVGIGLADVEEIDRFNIYNATLIAMKRAVQELKVAPDYLLVDGTMKEIDVPQKRTCLISGDSISISIACASIIAKVYRDSLMVKENEKFPEYGFAKHKGYGTREHIEAIKKFGLLPIHRRSFGPFGGRNSMPVSGHQQI